MCLDKKHKILTSKNQKEYSVSNSFIKKRNLSNEEKIELKRKRKEKVVEILSVGYQHPIKLFLLYYM
jgi:hypothetical protein